MAKWFVYEIIWKNGTPPIAKNLAIANRRLRRADWDVPLLTEDGFVESREWTGSHIDVFPRRWRNPLLTAEDVFGILFASNANPGRVSRWECRCESWEACDEGSTDCSFRRPHAGEDAMHNEAVWLNENFFRFEASRLHDGRNVFRNVPRFIR